MNKKKKQLLIEIKEGCYYDFLEKYSIKRDISFTQSAKQLLFDKIDELLKEEVKNNLECIKVEEVKEEIKPKKDLLKNLKNLKNDN